MPVACFRALLFDTSLDNTRFQRDVPKFRDTPIFRCDAYNEGIDSEFWSPIKTYWKDRSEEQGDKLRSLLTLEATSGSIRTV